MAEQTDNLILDILKKIQGDISIIKTDIRDLKLRANTTESEVRNGFFHTNETLARQQLTLDGFAERLSRLESRLALHE